MTKVIVITGASSGIGAETAQLLAKDGHQLVLGARRVDKLEEVASAVKTAGGQAVYRALDVTDHQQVKALADLALKAFGRIDVWINNAGMMPQAPFMANTISDWERAIDINIKGVLYGISLALPIMQKQESGHIITIGSVEGHHAHVGGGVYSGTKYAVRAMMDSLREEMAELAGDLRATLISPGAVTTELLQSVADATIKARYEDFYASHGIPASRVAQTIKYAIDMPADTAWNEVIMRPIKQVL